VVGLISGGGTPPALAGEDARATPCNAVSAASLSTVSVLGGRISALLQFKNRSNADRMKSKGSMACYTTSSQSDFGLRVGDDDPEISARFR